ncbi:MAG: T9SS type A sorting domain-containing protein [Bacteroidota bacterium]
MNKTLLFIIVISSTLSAQVQIGQDLNGESAGDLAGVEVSLSSDGNIVAIGSPGSDDSGNNSGSVRIFQLSNNQWSQIGNQIQGIAGEELGFSLSLSGDGTKLLIGSPFDNSNGNSSGSCKFFQLINNEWEQIGQTINGQIAEDQFGRTVSLSRDGSTVAVGSYINSNRTGFTRVYRMNDNNWIQIGQDIVGENEGDDASWSFDLSSDGSIIAIGSPGNDDNGNRSGHVRVFELENNQWSKIGSNIIGETSGDESGWSISISDDGRILAIGSERNGGNGLGSGHVRIYRNVDSQWIQIGSDINGQSDGDSSGWSVSLSSNGDFVAIGSPDNDSNGDRSGHVRLFSNVMDEWIQIGNDIQGENPMDESGNALSLSSDGKRIAIGALFNAENGEDSGHVRVYDLSAVLSSNEYVLNQFSLSPIPAKYQFSIELSQGLQLQNINIYNSIGQFMTSSKNSTVDISNFESGLYLVEIETNQGNATKKLIVE